MTVIITIILWLALLGLVAHWPGLDRRYARSILLCSVMVILAMSSFWRDVFQAFHLGQPLPLLEPSAAFASVWVLVLLPLWHQRLDGSVLARSLFAGLLAMALVSTALDIGHLAFSRFAFGTAFLSAALMTLMIAILMLTGFVLGRWIFSSHFTWEYAAWYAGWLIVAQPAHPTLGQIQPGTHHGLWTLAILFTINSGLDWSQRRR